MSTPGEHDPVQARRQDNVYEANTIAVSEQRANLVVNGMNATFGLIRTKAATSSKRHETSANDVCRAVLGIFDKFAGESADAPIFDLVVALFGGYEHLKPVQVLERLDRVVNQFDDRTLTIRELADELAAAMSVKFSTSRLQRQIDVIEQCSRCMDEFLRNKTSDDRYTYQKQFFKKANEAEAAMHDLISLNDCDISDKSVLEAQYDDSSGHIKPVAALAYVIHVAVFRAMICQQVSTIYEYGQAVWDQLLLAMETDFETFYKKITESLRRCKDEVGYNLNRDYRRGMRTMTLEKLWPKLLVNYEAIVDLRYLVVQFSSKSHNGWENTAIYCATWVKYIFNTVPAANKPDHGVFIFYWPFEEGDIKSIDGLQDEISVIVDELRASCVAASRMESSLPCCLMMNAHKTFNSQCLSELTVIPNTDKLTCSIIVADYATGFYNAEQTSGSGRDAKVCQFGPGRWTFSEGITTNGSISARFAWSGAVDDEHSGVVCIARRQKSPADGFFEITCHPFTDKCCEKPVSGKSYSRKKQQMSGQFESGAPCSII